MSKLESLARERFPVLTAAEIKLLQSAAVGARAFCGPSEDVRDVSNDPSTSETWGPERTIRADLVRWLCVDREAGTNVDPAGLAVHAARILGSLDLSSVTVAFPLGFACCRIEDSMNLGCAVIPEINLNGTHVKSIFGDGVRVASRVFLRKGFHSSGPVRLLGARIGGNLECDGGTFENPWRRDDDESGVALAADGAIVDGAVFLRNGFRAMGEVRLIGVQIGGVLDCGGGWFQSRRVDQSGEAGMSLNADGVRVMGAVSFCAGFRADGEVTIAGAQVGGDLVCIGSMFSNSASGVALAADRIFVGGSVVLGSRFVPDGGIRADGEVRLLGARIDRDLACDGAQLAVSRHAEEPRSLSAHAARVRGNVYMRYGFQAAGEVAFAGARIGGSLECVGGAFHGEVNLENAAIKRSLIWVSVRDPAQVRLTLESASVGTLLDDSASWPTPGNLILGGLVYERFSVLAPRAAEMRLDWLDRQKTFARQPYLQVAKVLRDEGDDKGARKVCYQMECRGARSAGSFVGRAWDLVLRYVVGYGYYPGRALLSLCILVVLGFSYFTFGFYCGSVVPTEGNAYALFTRTGSLPDNYARFHASFYSIENSVPLVRLGQADLWEPAPGPRAMGGSARGPVGRLLGGLVSPGLLFWVRLAQMGLGWFFATMGIAAVTGLVRRD